MIVGKKYVYPTMLSALSGAFSLATFLRTALEVGISRVGCQGGSVFLLDRVTGLLNLREHTYAIEAPLSLTPDEGVVGAAFQQQEFQIFDQADLAHRFVDRPPWYHQHLRGIAAIPVYLDRRPTAVFCFDFFANGSGKEAQTFTKSERAKIRAVTRDLQSEPFATSLRRTMVCQTRLELHSAAEALARQRQEVSRFLTRFQSSCAKAGKLQPDLIALQLVDRRRRVIRSVQGYGSGIPLAISALTHPLTSKDIQAHVVKTRRLFLIVGNDREHFAPKIFEDFGHRHLVRLFMPLFPFPVSRLGASAETSLEQALEEVIRQWVDWGEPEGDGQEVLRMIGRWREPFEPPEPIVYGTLEIGFRRADESSLEFAPFSVEIANLCAAQAYRLSDSLFRATLEGSLETIGRAIADLSGARTTYLTVALPDGSGAVKRVYPIDSVWSVAVPATVASQETSFSTSFVDVRFVDDITDSGVIDSDLREELQGAAAEAVLLALRLDDHLMDVFSLVEDDKERENVGTSFDPVIENFCQEACTLAGATECAFFLFERKGGSTGRLERVGETISWPRRESAAESERELKLATMVAESRTPHYPREAVSGELRHQRSTAGLPLELVDHTLGVVVLSYSKTNSLNDESQRVLEGRLLRWAHRVSLRRLVVMNRFSLLMSRLRSLVHEARESAAATVKTEPLHAERFVRNILCGGVSQLQAQAGIVTIYARTATGPSRVERFWCCRASDGAPPQSVQHHFFIDRGSMSPCRTALQKADLQVYGPGDPRRIEHTRSTVGELLEALPEMTESPEAGRCLNAITDFCRDAGPPSTMVVFPAPSRGRAGRDIDLAVTVFLTGEHHYGQVHRRLILEVGELIAEGYAHMNSLDQKVLEKRFNRFLGNGREKLRNAQDVEELIAGLFLGLGRAEDSGLADDAVLWLLSPERRELILYSACGKAIEVESRLQQIPFAAHPLFKDPEIVVFPKKNAPWLNGPFQLWTFDLQKDVALNPVGHAYASISGVQWLMSFPLVDTDKQLVGVVDLLRNRSLAIEEESALEAVLQRLSLQFCSALENCRLRRTELVARELNSAAAQHLGKFRAQAVYRTLIHNLRREFRCTHCDLLLERDGTIRLHSSTRKDGPESEKGRVIFWAKRASGSKEPVGECLGQGKAVLLHAGEKPRSTQHLSEALEKLFADDYQFERLSLPLKIEGSLGTNGVVFLRGPVDKVEEQEPVSGTGLLKKAAIFSEEELRIGEYLAVAIQRILRMAWLVESQGWMVSEMAHSLGQPLQVLRARVDEMLGSLSRLGMAGHELRTHRQEIDRAFNTVSEERGDLSFVGSVSQPTNSARFHEVDLAEIVRSCFDLLGPAAFRKEVRFFLEVSKPVAPVFCDRTLLRRAIQNLLDNAVKYSYRRREVVVGISEDRSGNLTLSVTNYGVGIPAEHFDRIFEPWFRSRVPDQRGERPGRGIGLTIAREAVETHQGELKVKSRPRNDEQANVLAVTNVEHTTIFTLHLNREKLQRLRPVARVGGSVHA